MAPRAEARASAWWIAFRARQFARARGTCCVRHAEERKRRGRECERGACSDPKGRAHALLVLPGVPGDVRRLVVCRRCYAARKDHRFAHAGGSP